MAADAKIMEALARLEHKVDILMKTQFSQAQALDLAVPDLKVGDTNHSCPLCHQPVDYHVDVMNSVVVRKCGCSTGKIALDLGAFAPPALPCKKKEQEDEQRYEEDRSNPDRRGRG